MNKLVDDVVANLKEQLIKRIGGRANMAHNTWMQSYQGQKKPFPPDCLVRKQAYETALLDIEAIL